MTFFTYYTHLKRYGMKNPYMTQLKTSLQTASQTMDRDQLPIAIHMGTKRSHDFLPDL